MNEETPIPTSKPKRTRKPAKVRAPRVVDPAEQQIKAEAKARIEQHRLALKSAGVLENIKKLVTRLTPEHRTELSMHLESCRISAAPHGQVLNQPMV